MLKIRNSSAGIGDMVCGLYTAQALKDRYPEHEIVYCVRKPEWFFDVKDISVVGYEQSLIEPYAHTDIYVGVHQENRVSKRKVLFAQKVPLLKLKPTAPKLSRECVKNSTLRITLFPNAVWKNREWDMTNWRILESSLLKKGYEVTVMLTDEALKDQFKSTVICNANPKDVIERILWSTVVVCNDSGMAHVAGMYNVPCVSIFGGYTTEFLFSQTNVVGVRAETIDKIELNKVLRTLYDLINKSIDFKSDKSIQLTLVAGLQKGDGLGKVGYNIAKGFLQEGVDFSCVYYGNAEEEDNVSKGLMEKNSASIGKVSLVTSWVGGVPLSIYELSDVYEIAMFEAEGEIPNDWLVRWNSLCKGLIVPDQWNKDNFQKCGVKIPIHVIPCAMDFDGLDKNKFNDDIFTFGITSQYEERKNHELVIKAFLKKFGNSKKHKLKVHGRWGHLYEDLKKYEQHNIEIICRKLSNNEFERWWSDIDCYILCSSGEGYSYTPREAILRGIPTIVSDCTAHKVLTQTGGVYGIKPTGMKDAFKHIWGVVVGRDYTFSVNSVANAMGEVFACFDEWKEKVKLADKYIRKEENMKVITKKLLSVI